MASKSYGALADTISLHNGLAMPRLGLGTWQTPEGEIVQQSIKWAIEAGYRHVDTAALYKNERGVGKAIRESGLPRKDIFVTTKLWTAPMRKGYDAVLAACDESLEKLGFDYVDLYLIHWPVPVPAKNRETWAAMEKIYADGKARAIGVSNFLVHHLEELLPAAKVVPMVNQVEFHPLLMQRDLMRFCREHKIVEESWSPMANGRMEQNEVVRGIAQKHGKTFVQIVARWNWQHDVVVIPKSVHRERIIDNAKIFDFELSPDEMARLDALDCAKRTGGDPDNFPYF